MTWRRPFATCPHLLSFSSLDQPRSPSVEIAPHSGVRLVRETSAYSCLLLIDSQPLYLILLLHTKPKKRPLSFHTQEKKRTQSRLEFTS